MADAGAAVMPWALLSSPWARRVALWAAIALAGFLALSWARWDAVRDYRAALAEQTYSERLRAIERDRKRDEEIENMGLDDLGRAAREWVRGAE